MEPKTKLQKRAVELSKTLKDLTPDQRAWACKNILEHVAYRTPANTKCLDCGATWKTVGNADPKALLTILDDKKTCTCPECGTKLKIEDTRHLTMEQRKFYTTIEVVKEFQVVRIYEIRAKHKARQPANIWFCEVASQWILPDGRYELIARVRGGMGYHDNFNGYLEIRGKHSFFEKYNIEADGIYPKMGILPIYKQHGFKRNFHGLTPHNLFVQLGHSTIAETLLKRGEIGFLTALCLGDDKRKAQVKKHWPSIRIAMRHGYQVSAKKVVDYLDHLELLNFFGEDMNSPHFVCPADFKKEHQRYIAKKQAWNDRQSAEEQRAQIVKDNGDYVAQKGIFFGFLCTDGNIVIRVIESVQEVYEHGKALKHCVFSNQYHKRESSLLLAAMVDGQLAETIEVDLKNMKIAQARGLQNGIHKEHSAIVNLLNTKLPEVKKLYKKHQRATVAV